MIHLHKLVRFFPYESVHASNAVIHIEDENLEWYAAIRNFLKDYESDEYCLGCNKRSFNIEMDNKITLELTSDFVKDKSKFIYLTYWDGTVSISNHYHFISRITRWCTAKLKK